jgi:glycerophosphoryl diester phosphodiesterase
MSPALRIGHRGAAGHAPENTLAAVQKGIDLGVDFVEIDVRLTADGVPVALHDATINRTTDGRGRVEAFSLDRLRGFDAGHGQHIPTLEDILHIAAGRTGVMIELKVAGAAGPAVEAVRKAQFGNRVIYASFLHQELTEVQAIAQDAALMPLFDKPPKAMAYHPTLVGLRHDRARRDVVEAFHQQNALVWVYTPNTVAEIRNALDAGVDGVISDFPERIPAQ